ncbi:hypothetical protein MRF4_24785 [Methylobacterium radiotolerans]|uniref:OPT/YSL family transporter n=1 Tax=Methylobacterium TaxID=407 RepID=UPI002F3290F8
MFGVATIANDSLQDLKTGQLVGATPGKRQVAPVIAVAFGLVIVPPVPNTSSGGASASRAHQGRAPRMGTPAAAGLIVGDSLRGVAFALIVYLTGRDTPGAPGRGGAGTGADRGPPAVCRLDGGARRARPACGLTAPQPGPALTSQPHTRISAAQRQRPPRPA